MAEYRLSEQADIQLEELYVYGVKTFGVYQSEAYVSGLRRIFELIADFPLMGPSVEFLKVGLRRFRFQAHYIYYWVETDYVLIAAIISQRLDVKPNLFE